MKLYIKTDQKIIKFNDIEIVEYKFHQNKNPILINNIDINKLINFLLVNKILNISLVTKILKKLDFNAYIFHKD